MANEKLCFKDYLTCPDDKKLSKTRRKMNAKSPAKRVYGLDWGMSGPANISGASDGTGAAMGESDSRLSEMLNGGIPGVFTANVLGGVQTGIGNNMDTKKQNKRNAPRKMSLNQFLRYRTRAEDEEEFDDEEVDNRVGFNDTDDYDEEGDFAQDYGMDPMQKREMGYPDSEFSDEELAMFKRFDDEDEPENEFDRFDRNKERGADVDEFMSAGREDDEYDEDAYDGDGNEQFGALRQALKGYENEEQLDLDIDPEVGEDMTGETCRRCGEGQYKETSIMDDMDGVLHCSNCGDRVERYSGGTDENEEDDVSELNFDDDENGEHDLDREFQDPDGDMEDDFEDDDADEYGDMANKMVDSLSDDTVDDIDEVTGTVAKWWREQVVGKKPAASEFDNDEFGDEADMEYDEFEGGDEDEFNGEYSDDEYEEEQETPPGGAPGATPPGMAGPATAPGMAPSVGPKGPPKIDKARLVFQQMVQQPDSTRGDIIAAFVQDIDITQSTAVSYYERLAKEAGLTADDVEGMGAETPRTSERPEMQQQSIDELPTDTPPDLEDKIVNTGDPNRQGIIRTIDNAHLVYKRQSEDGTFEELWNFNTGGKVEDELTIRRAILAGTDIPQSRTQSEDGSQSYSLETLGNAQLIHITGLPN